MLYRTEHEKFYSKTRFYGLSILEEEGGNREDVQSKSDSFTCTQSVCRLRDALEEQ